MKRELQETGSKRFRTFYTRGLNCENLLLNFFALDYNFRMSFYEKEKTGFNVAMFLLN